MKKYMLKDNTPEPQSRQAFPGGGGANPSVATISVWYEG